jgi:PAS domain S-box-containing protein
MKINAPQAYRLLDRRRPRPPGESTAGFLSESMALIVFRRQSIPVLAVDDNGVIVFVNDAFAAMIGHRRAALLSVRLGSLLHSGTLPEFGVVAVLRARANSVMELRQADGGVVPVLVGEPTLLRQDGTLALAAFSHHSALMWHEVGGTVGVSQPRPGSLAQDGATTRLPSQKSTRPSG